MSEMPVFKGPFESNSSSEPVKKPHKTIRLNIDLTQINKEGSVVFNYNKLLNEEKARIERREKGDSKSDKDSKKLKFTDNRYHSYAELGAGYDDDDSFIDNTDANEEGLPENMDTKFGGYYINSGTLELKKTFIKHETSSSSSSEEASDSESSSSEEVKKVPPIRKDLQDSNDIKKPVNEIEVRKKPKVIHVPMREKPNGNNSLYPVPPLQVNMFNKYH